MARIIIEGFENITYSEQNTQWDSNSFNAISDEQHQMTGTFVSDAGNGIVSLEQNPYELYLAFRTKSHSSINSHILNFRFTLYDPLETESETDRLFKLTMDLSENSYGLSHIVTENASVGSGSLIYGSLFFPENHWEIRLKNNQDNTFLCQIKKNGELIFDESDIPANWTNYTGDMDFFGTGTYFEKFQIRIENQLIDDLIIDDAEWCGNSRVYRLVPTASGDTDDWAPKEAGVTNASMLNSANDTTYIESNTADQKSFFNLTDLPDEVLEIKNVRVQSRSLTPGYPILEHIQTGLKTNDSEFFTASKELTNNYEPQDMNLYTLNPATGLAWTVDEINALQIGVKAKSS